MWQALADNGYFVCAYDLREHGQTDQDIGYIFEFKDIIEDTLNFIKLAEDYTEKIFKTKLPKFICGQSMGSLIVYYVSQKINFRGVVYATPCFNVPYNSFMRNMAATFSFVYPQKSFSLSEISPNSKNPVISEDIDPIIAKRLVAIETVNSVFYQLAELEKKEKKSHEKAMLVIVVGIEKLVVNKDTFEYYNNSKVKDKTM